MSSTRVDADRRLGELILYIATKSVADRRFGDTKLNKLLFFSDFIAHAVLGEPITGAVYQKLPHGPCPRRVLPVREALGDAVDLVVEGVGFPRRRTVAKRAADLSLFTAAQIALVDEVVDHFWNYTAGEIEAVAHRASVGWQIAAMKEDIPYATALLSPELPSDETIEFARERFTPSAT